MRGGGGGVYVSYYRENKHIHKHMGQIPQDGLDLTCSLFWGLNSDDFPFLLPL